MKIAVVVLLAVVSSVATEGAFVGYNNRPVSGASQRNIHTDVKENVLLQMSPETLALVEEFRAQAELLEQTGRPSNSLPFGPDMLKALRPKTEETNSAEQNKIYANIKIRELCCSHLAGSYPW